MSTTALAPAPVAAPSRTTARTAGLLYLVTFLTSVPTLALYAPLRERPGQVLDAADRTGVVVGALLEVGLALSCVATAVVVFPVVRRHGERAALGYLAARVVEGALVLVGVISVLALVGLPQQATADPGSTAVVGRALLAVYEGTFLLGQSLMPVLCALTLGSLLLRSGLVPRAIPLVGLAGAPLLLASDVAIATGVYEQGTALAGLAALPIAAWELSLAVWLVVRGFRVPDPAA